MRVLVVEDEDRIADFLMRALNAEGHTCVRCASGEEAISLVLNGDYELVLLDLMLPDMSGLDVCRSLRYRKNDILIIMLTALDSTDDVVHGLRAGADDYISKPFDIDELLVRMEVVSRRKEGVPQPGNSVLCIADVSLNCESKVVTVADKQITMTARELTLLELLMSNPHRLFSRERILNSLWGTNTDPLTNVVDVYIGRIRRKLGKEKLPFIETVRGLGYRIHPDAL